MNNVRKLKIPLSLAFTSKLLITIIIPHPYVQSMDLLTHIFKLIKQVKIIHILKVHEWGQLKDRVSIDFFLWLLIFGISFPTPIAFLSHYVQVYDALRTVHMVTNAYAIEKMTPPPSTAKSSLGRSHAHKVLPSSTTEWWWAWSDIFLHA